MFEIRVLGDAIRPRTDSLIFNQKLVGFKSSVPIDEVDPQVSSTARIDSQHHECRFSKLLNFLVLQEIGQFN